MSPASLRASSALSVAAGMRPVHSLALETRSKR